MGIFKKKPNIEITELLARLMSQIMRLPPRDVSKLKSSKGLPKEKIKAINKNLENFGLIAFYFTFLDLIRGEKIKIDFDQFDKYFFEAYFMALGINQDSRSEKEMEISYLTLIEEIQDYYKHLIDVRLQEFNSPDLAYITYQKLLTIAFSDKHESFKNMTPENIESRAYEYTFCSEIAKSFTEPIEDILKLTLKDLKIIFD